MKFLFVTIVAVVTLSMVAEANDVLDFLFNSRKNAPTKDTVAVIKTDKVDGFDIMADGISALAAENLQAISGTFFKERLGLDFKNSEIKEQLVALLNFMQDAITIAKDVVNETGSLAERRANIKKLITDFKGLIKPMLNIVNLFVKP